MKDFKTWKDKNRLIDTIVKVPSLTWYNGSSSSVSVERKLDKAFCNNSWLDSCQTMVSTTLPRLKSNHHPILVEAYFTQLRVVLQFKFMEM